MTKDDERYWANMVIGVIDNLERPMLMYEGEKMIVRKALKAYLEANDRKTEPSDSEIPNNCDTCKFELYCPEMCEGCCEWDSHYEPKTEPQTEVSAQEYERWLFKEPQTSRENTRDSRDNHEIAKDEQQTERIKTHDYCDICNHKGCKNCIANNLDDYCVPSGYEPTTQAETQNSNLTFEKRTMSDCYNCKRYETEDECIECHYEPKDEPQTYVINPQEPTNDDKCFECDDFFVCGGQCNKIEDEPQTDYGDYERAVEQMQHDMRYEPTYNAEDGSM